MASHTFQYVAHTSDGSNIESTVTARDRSDAESILRKKGYTIDRLTESEQPITMSKADRWLLRFTRVSLTDKVFFLQHLEVMLRTGFSIGRALRALIRQTDNKRFRLILDEVREKVESGMTLAKALREYPDVFSALMVNMIESGEMSGQLNEVLKQITVQLRKESSLRSKVRGAMIYPIIVVAAMIGIGAAMMIFVIPRISDIYAEVNVQLPLPTRILIGMSTFIVSNGILVGGSLIVIVFGFLRLLKTKRGKHVFHAVLLKLPVVGPIIKKINLARFARTLSSMMRTDLPIVKAFEIISTTLGNVYYQEAVADAASKLKQGVSISQTLERYERLFPPIATQMINVGEESGTLDETTQELAQFYEENVDQTMSNLSTITEPILMVVLGVGVGAMAVAIILPMYSLADTI